jgi:uracil-DNA glycosylase
VVLGGIALNTYLSIVQSEGRIKSRAQFRFAHGALYRTHEGGPYLLASYHPSQQNTSTGRLTAEMLRDIFLKARRLVADATETNVPRRLTAAEADMRIAK